MTEVFDQRIEEVHYTALHTALEQFHDRDFPGKITRIQYPSGDTDGQVEITFTTVEESERQPRGEEQ